MKLESKSLQTFPDWPMSHAKLVIKDNYEKSRISCRWRDKKVWTDKNCPAEKSWPNHVKSEQHIGYKILLNTVQYFLSPPWFFFLLLDLFFSLASNHRERALHLFSRFHLRREFGNGILRNGKGHSLWLARFDRKCRFIFSPLTLFSRTSG